MANYVKSTNFASKDSLATGNPLKVVKGTEIDVEFNAIATAVQSKADSASPTFTGTPFAPTASPGTNTTQVATTAFVTAADVAERTATATLTNKTVNLTNNTLSGTVAQFNTALSDGDFATLSGTETLTNKTVNLTNNTVSGTKAQFNTACSDTDFAFVNDFTSTNQSLTTNGYQKLPGGLIIQWGRVGNGTANNGGSSGTVTFPIAFPNALLNVQLTVREPDNNGATVARLTLTDSTTQFSWASFSGTSSSALDQLMWLAVGY